MSWSSAFVVAAAAASAGCATQPAVATQVCPQRTQPLKFVDVIDGPVEEMATLVPDHAGAKSGYWSVSYVYDAGRYLTVRCKYGDGQAAEVKLARRVARCDYAIDPAGVLALRCN